MTCFVTKAPPINSINSKCRTEKLKGSRTCLIGYSDAKQNSLAVKKVRSQSEATMAISDQNL